MKRALLSHYTMCSKNFVGSEYAASSHPSVETSTSAAEAQHHTSLAFHRSFFA
jgi:hypothetical protein